METLLQQTVNGLVVGSVYALVALGYTMVYGILGLINFAHGDVLMIGALVALEAIRLIQLYAPDLGLIPTLLGGLGMWLANRLVGVLAQKIMFDLRTRLFVHTQRLDVG